MFRLRLESRDQASFSAEGLRGAILAKLHGSLVAARRVQNNEGRMTVNMQLVLTSAGLGCSRAYDHCK